MCKNIKFPSEDEIVDLIINSVDIHGIDLINYRYEFTNKRSNLYNNLVELFKRLNNDANFSLNLKCKDYWNNLPETTNKFSEPNEINPLSEQDYWEFYKELIRVISDTRY